MRFDPRALSERFLDSLRFPGRAGEVWARLGLAEKRDKLRWQHLPPDRRLAYLVEHAAEVDPKVPLQRIEDPKLMPPGESPLPPTVARELVWEGRPLSCAEIITEDCYDTLDVLFDDVARVASLAETQPGFHIHHVAELTSPDAVRAAGSKITGLAGLENLRIFFKGVREGSNLLTHTHLEVWRAADLAEVAASFGDGQIDPDAIDIHKFHNVGMREGIYGGEGRLGLELRAVRVGEGLELARVSQRMTDTLADPAKLDAVPAPPWGDFDAGRAGIAAEAYAEAKAGQPVEACARGALAIAEPFEAALVDRALREQPELAALKDRVDAALRAREEPIGAPSPFSGAWPSIEPRLG